MNLETIEALLRLSVACFCASVAFFLAVGSLELWVRSVRRSMDREWLQEMRQHVATHECLCERLPIQMRPCSHCTARVEIAQAEGRAA